jgi:hypothetical protein
MTAVSESSRSTSSARGSCWAEEALELARLDEHELGAGLVGARLAASAKSCQGEEQLGLGIRQVERRLASLEQDVHRDDGRARAQRAVVGEREVRDVRQHDADAVARLDPLAASMAAMRAEPSSSWPYVTSTASSRIATRSGGRRRSGSGQSQDSA